MHRAWIVSRPLAAVVLCLLRVTTPAVGVSDASEEEVKEYCETDSFQAYCDDHSVIVMTSALYGRMRLGRCVRKDVGYLGCKADVLDLMDARCSGRQSCQVRIPDPDLDQTKPCLEELKTYLEASYQCVHVEKPFGACDGIDNDLSWSITRSSRTGYISTGTILDTRCGKEDSPIRISAWPGQRLNITVYDFSYAAAAAAGASFVPGSPSVPGNSLSTGPTGFGIGSQLDTECGHFVVFFDPEVRRQIKVCPGLRRIRNVYVTGNRSVDVFFKRVGPDVFDQRFLIQFTVLGCAEIRPTEEMWMHRGENEADIGCRGSDQKWRLTCVDNRWEGTVGNCSNFVPFGATADIDIDRNLEHGKGIVIVLCVALLMGIVVLVLGALGLLLRRFQRQSSHHDSDAFRAEGKKPEVSEYCQAMCAVAAAASGHLESELSGESTSGASSSSCKYVVRRCVCQDGSRLFAENNYAPTGGGGVGGVSAHAPAEVFGHPFPVSFGRVKSDRMCVQSTPDGNNQQQRLAEGDYRSSPTARNALTVIHGESTDYEACSCGQAPAIELYPNDVAAAAAAGKYAFWKTQRRLTSAAYCPVYSGQCPQIAEEFMK